MAGPLMVVYATLVALAAMTLKPFGMLWSTGCISGLNFHQRSYWHSESTTSNTQQTANRLGHFRSSSLIIGSPLGVEVMEVTVVP